ncbi:MAG: cation:proton antiporter [Candidatus Accumulibacter sp.]|nr:cation:proton antiporter [Accumulibacter sp.]
MSSAEWFLLVGGLLLSMGLSQPTLGHLPVTSAIIYLLVGLVVGPTVLNVFHFNPLKQSALLEVLTEAAVLISLHAAGVKMPVPVKAQRWRTPILLAVLSMTVTVGLGLFDLHKWGNLGLHWILVDVLWATAVGILVGVLCGMTLAHLGKRLRGEGNEHQLMDDFLGLGLIGVVYSLSLLLSTWGFLAVFFAAVALRQTEQRLANVAVPTAGVAKPMEGADAIREAPPSVSGGSLVFKEHLERLSEVLLILLIGGSLFLDSWSWRSVGLAAFLFAVARPLSVLVGLLGSGNSWRVRGLAGWFGVRGIDSLYYLIYAIEHGLPEGIALELIHMTLIVVTLSILVHGISVKPLMERCWNRHGRGH